MRRSNSASKIPLRSSFQSSNMEERRRERSRSAIRREPSMDRLMVTPLGFPGSSVKSSVQKKQILWTPSSSVRDTTRSTFSQRVSRGSRPRSPFNKKSTQLTNDKQWVNQQYHKILEYVEYSGLFNPELAKKLRPPTVTAFADLISGLFQKLLPNPAPITSLNYIEVAVKSLKLLEYPGQLSNSTLKTINTMHCWPNFISIVSWLIEQVQMPEKIKNAFEDHYNPSVQRQYKKYELFHQFIYNVYYTYMASGEINVEQLQLELAKMRQDLSDILGIDEELKQKCEELLQSNQEELSKISQEIQEIEEKNHELNRKNVHMQNTISDYEENKDIWEQEIKDEIAKLNKDIEKLSVEKKSLVTTVNELKDCIASQPWNISDKNELLSKIQNEKKVIERKTKKIHEYRLFRDKLDLELSNELSKVEKRVDEWNVLITKLVLPELQCLRLRESGFTGFWEELVAIGKEKDIIATKLHQEYTDSMAKLENLQAWKESLTVNQKSIDASKQKRSELKTEIQAANQEKNTITANIEEFKTHPEKMKQIGAADVCKIEEQREIIEALKKRQQEQSYKKQAMIKYGKAALVEAHEVLLQTINQYEEKVKSLMLETAIDVEEATNHLHATFEHLLKVKKNSQELLNIKLLLQ